ncbi:hypothetical protein C8R45DRAFT_935976 [Mycena sanguinolenta]|nr:hypothetical protein C8R45DRAFT_935976 [Mycena sanguinolenta]
MDSREVAAKANPTPAIRELCKDEWGDSLQHQGWLPNPPCGQPLAYIEKKINVCVNEIYGSEKTAEKPEHPQCRFQGSWTRIWWPNGWYAHLRKQPGTRVMSHGVPSWTHILVFSSFNPVALRRFIVVIALPNLTLWCPLDHGVPSWTHILVFSSFNPAARRRLIVKQTGHFWGMRTEYHNSDLAATSSVNLEIIFGHRYLEFPTPRGIHRMLPREYLVELVYFWLAFPCITLIDKRSGNRKICRNNPVPMWMVFYGLIIPSALKWRRYGTPSLFGKYVLLAGLPPYWRMDPDLGSHLAFSPTWLKYLS